jgi:hypothetical protein
LKLHRKPGEFFACITRDFNFPVHNLCLLEMA